MLFTFAAEDRATAWRSAIIALMALVLFFQGLGETSLPSFDDAYHAQTAKEMLHRLDPIGISYGGNFSFESSPLPNWLMAASYVIFGVNEYAARFPIALLALLGIGAVYRFARGRWGANEAVAAAFILTTSFLYLRYGRHAMAEIPIAFFTTLAVLAFVDGLATRRYLRFGVYTGLAILCKSALGAMPALIAIVALIALGRARELFSKPFMLAGAAASGVAAVWYVPAILIHGQRFFESHIGAYLAVHTLSGHHAELGFLGIFFYLIWLPIQYLPWTLPLLPALVHGFSRRRQDDALLVFALAVVVPLVLLSLITSKYTRYLMPVFPAAALLIVGYWRQKCAPAAEERIVKIMSALAAVIAIALIVLPVSLSDDRNDEIRGLAPAIVEKASGFGELVNYRLPHFKYQNPLLFYTDLRLAPVSDDPAAIFRKLQPGAERFGLTDGDGFAELVQKRPAGTILETVDHIGEIIFFRAALPAPDRLMAELRSFTPLINRLDDSDFLATYKLPHPDVILYMRKEYGRRIMPEADQRRRLLRSMLSRGARLGICSRNVTGELLELPDDLPGITILATGEYLALFQIDDKIS